MDAPIITLTTDWGEGDFFAGMVKGVLCKHIGGVRVVDITHKVRKYNIMEASFFIWPCPSAMMAQLWHLDITF